MAVARERGRQIVEDMEKELRSRDNVEIFTSAKLTNFEGFFGNYQATIETPEGEKKIMAAASSLPSVSPRSIRSIKPELGYGRDPRIMTTLDLERMGDSLEPPRQAEGRHPPLRRVAGRADRQALLLADLLHQCPAGGEGGKGEIQDSYVESFYMDVRAHPRGGEEFFEDTQEKGVLFTRANVAEIIPTQKGSCFRGEDTLFGESFEREFDLAVLSIGMSSPADAGTSRPSSRSASTRTSSSSRPTSNCVLSIRP